MEPLSRPVPPESPGARLRAWVAWFGVARLVATCVATVIVAAGAYWLLRSPAPPTEASLPRADPTSSTLPTGPMAPTASSVPVVAVEPSIAEPMTILVHVAGAVTAPGVYELPAGARIRDAVVAAQGPTELADWNELNLAAPLGDGTRVYVPMVDEEVDQPLVSGGAPVATEAGSAPMGPIDVNRADAATLEQLPGVGPATAAAIVLERERNGPFVNVDDLLRVPGIGPAKLDGLRDLATT